MASAGTRKVCDAVQLSPSSTLPTHSFAFCNEIVTSHGVIFSLGVTYPDPLFEGRLPEAFCQAGNGSGTCERVGDATSVPGPYSGSLVGHYDPARSDHGQRLKGQDAALARRKARGVTLHAQGPAIRARPGATHSRAGLA